MPFFQHLLTIGGVCHQGNGADHCQEIFYLMTHLFSQKATVIIVRHLGQSESLLSHSR